MYWDVNNLHRWTMLQEHIDGFKWRNDNYNFNKHFIKIMMKIRTKHTYLK